MIQILSIENGEGWETDRNEEGAAVLRWVENGIFCYKIVTA